MERHAHNEFDGYIVLDADNVLERDFVSRMNETFSEGKDIVTCYRDSKNYGDNWISAGYGLWFLRESRYLNGARSRIGARAFSFRAPCSKGRAAAGRSTC